MKVRKNTARFLIALRMVCGDNVLDTAMLLHDGIAKGGLVGYGRERKLNALRSLSPELVAQMEEIYCDVNYVFVETVHLDEEQAYKFVKDAVKGLEEAYNFFLYEGYYEGIEDDMLEHEAYRPRHWHIWAMLASVAMNQHLPA